MTRGLKSFEDRPRRRAKRLVLDDKMFIVHNEGMEKIKPEKVAESAGYALAKSRFLEELASLSTTYDHQTELSRKEDLWGEQLAKIKAGEKLSRTHATTLQMAIEIAQRAGLSGLEYDAFISEFFMPRRRRDNDD